MNALHKNLWYYSLLVLIATLISLCTGNLIFVIIPSFIGFVYWALLFYKINNLPFPGGLPNIITLARFFALILVSFFSSQIQNFNLGILFSGICIADFFDGYFARKLNKTSVIGEYLDKETDALFVLFLSMIIYFKIHHTLWVLIPGLIRYLYFIGIYFLLKDNQKEDKDPWARIIAVYVFISLLAMFLLPSYIAKVGLLIGTVAIIYSFGRSVMIQSEIIRR